MLKSDSPHFLNLDNVFATYHKALSAQCSSACSHIWMHKPIYNEPSFFPPRPTHKKNFLGCRRVGAPLWCLGPHSRASMHSDSPDRSFSPLPIRHEPFPGCRKRLLPHCFQTNTRADQWIPHLFYLSQLVISISKVAESGCYVNSWKTYSKHKARKMVDHRGSPRNYLHCPCIGPTGRRHQAVRPLQ